MYCTLFYERDHDIIINALHHFLFYKRNTCLVSNLWIFPLSFSFPFPSFTFLISPFPYLSLPFLTFLFLSSPFSQKNEELLQALLNEKKDELMDKVQEMQEYSSFANHLEKVNQDLLSVVLFCFVLFCLLVCLLFCFCFCFCFVNFFFTFSSLFGSFRFFLVVTLFALFFFFLMVMFQIKNKKKNYPKQ